VGSGRGREIVGRFAAPLERDCYLAPEIVAAGEFPAAVRAL